MALNNLKWLICHKTKPKQTFIFLTWSLIYPFSFIILFYGQFTSFYPSLFTSLHFLFPILSFALPSFLFSYHFSSFFISLLPSAYLSFFLPTLFICIALLSFFFLSYPLLSPHFLFNLFLYSFLLVILFYSPFSSSWLFFFPPSSLHTFFFPSSFIFSFSFFLSRYHLHLCRTGRSPADW